MIAADGAIALATTLLGVLYALGAARVGQVYALLFVRALGAAFHKPAMIASTTLMAPRDYLPRVAGLNHTLEGVAGIAIPPLGALALAALPMQAILAIDVLTALPAIATLLVVAIPQPPRTESVGARPSVWGEMRAGLSYVWGWKALLAFAAIGTVINLMGRGAGALMPILVSKQRGRCSSPPS